MVSKYDNVFIKITSKYTHYIYHCSDLKIEFFESFIINQYIIQLV